MKYITEGREPFAPFRYFEEISAIPRGSYHEEKIADYLVEFGKGLGLEARKDEWNNVYIRKPGSKGCENLEPVILQSHIDMVCEKNKDVEHNFETDPIELYIENDILRARGTTLGADNGIGVAYTMAALAEKDAVHPPLECLFTSMEEVGLTGAYHADTSFFTGRRMINMDSCPEGGLLVSSAGGMSVTIQSPVVWTELHEHSKVVAIRVRGLMGGHSGCDIEKERGNSNKLMGRILSRLEKAGVKYELCEINGGAMSNAIPRECDAVLCVCENDVELLHETVKTVEQEQKAVFADSDPGVYFVVEDAAATRSFDKASTARLVKLLNLLPSGRISMSVSIKDLTTLSLNQGVVTTKEDHVEIQYSIRSALTATMNDLASDLIEMAELIGGICESSAGYPTWEYKQESKLREVMLDTFKELRGKEGFIQSVHGGVECAVFAGEFPDMDIVAMGPDVDGVHTPDEWLDLNSFGRTYEYLLAVLKNLTKVG